MPNTSDRKRIQEYAISVNDLEDIIGIDIFTNIDDRFWLELKKVDTMQSSKSIV